MLDSGSSPSGGPQTPMSAFAEPPNIADYELLRRVGRGAYGEVWLARSETGALRAIKIVRRSSFDHDRPFQREFEGIRNFEPISRRHESQVDILHVGRGADYFFYVMELADDQATGGQINPQDYHPRTLKSDLLFRSRLPFEECVSVGIALTTALQHLHENGLVHRDVKPSNIVFVNGVAKLADIGLVTGLDTTRSYVGTEGFAAPEGPGTPQADLYSLGKVLYEMSTGKDRQEFPELPEDLRDLPEQEGIVELNTVIARACAHSPLERYPTAAAMRAELGLLQSGKSLARLHRVETRLRRLRRTGLLFGALLVLLSAGFWFQRVQTQEARSLAEENLRLAGHNSQIAQERSTLYHESQERLAHLHISNGMRMLDIGDPAAALLWFAQALPMLTNNPAAEAIHRIRLQQTIRQLPHVIGVYPGTNLAGPVAISPNRQWLAIITGDGSLKLWDLPSGTPLPFPELAGQVRHIDFTSDSSKLLLTSLERLGPSSEAHQTTNHAYVIDLPTLRPIFTKSGVDLLRAQFSSDGRMLVAADSNGVHLIETAHGNEVCRMHTTPPLVMQLSTNASVLLSIPSKGPGQLWSLPSGVELPAIQQLTKHSRLSGSGLRVYTVEEKIVGGQTNTLVQVWDTQTGTRVGPQLQAPAPFANAWFETPETLCLLSVEPRRYLFDIASGRVIHSFAFDIPDTGLCSSPDSRQTAFGDKSGNLQLLDWRSGQRLSIFRVHQKIRDLSDIGPDGTILMITEDGSAIMYKLMANPEDAFLQLRTPVADGRPGDPRHRFSSDRSRFLVRRADFAFNLLDVALMQQFQIPAMGVGWFSIDASGKQLALHYEGSPNGEKPHIEVWSAGIDIAKRFVIPCPSSMQTFLEFSPDGRHLLAAFDRNDVRIWSTTKGTLERSITLPDGLQVGDLLSGRGTILGEDIPGNRFVLFNINDFSVMPLTDMPPMNILKRAFDSTGRLMATVAEGQGWTRVWNTETGHPVSPILNHGTEVNYVEFSPDGKRLLSSGSSPEVRVWNISDGGQVLNLLSGDKQVRMGLWSPDGRFIVTSNDRNEARVWDAATGEPVTPAQTHTGDLRYVVITAHNQLVTLSYPDQIRRWELRPTEVMPEFLVDYSMLVAGRSLTPSGVEISLAAEKRLEILNSLRQSDPALVNP